MRLLIGAVAAALTLASAAQSQEGFDAIWADYGESMRAQGINEPMARLAMHWTELQYHLGLCRGAGLAERDIAFWREWWKDTPLTQSPFGRRIIGAGNQAYTEGLEDRLTSPLDSTQCQRVLDSWMAETREIMAAYPAASRPMEPTTEPQVSRTTPPL